MNQVEEPRRFRWRNSEIERAKRWGYFNTPTNTLTN